MSYSSEGRILILFILHKGKLCFTFACEVPNIAQMCKRVKTTCKSCGNASVKEEPHAPGVDVNTCPFLELLEGRVDHCDHCP
jgi:hypothetical protein